MSIVDTAPLTTSITHEDLSRAFHSDRSSIGVDTISMKHFEIFVCEVFNLLQDIPSRAPLAPCGDALFFVDSTWQATFLMRDPVARVNITNRFGGAT